MASHFNLRFDGGSKSKILILGLDLGTTSFKIAMLAVEENSQAEDPLQLFRNPDAHVIVLENFPGHHRHQLSSVPTCLIYNCKRRLWKWGREAEIHHGEKNFDPNFFVHNWKMSIHKSSDPAASRLRQSIEALAAMLGKDETESFAEDFSRALFALLLEDKERSPILKHWGTDLRVFKHIDIVLAVPPGWPRHEHEALSNAVSRGLGDKQSFRIFRVSETECVLKTWMQEGGQLINAQHGDILLLLDLGGGTVCISVFRCEVAGDGKLTCAHMESHSLSAGSEVVTEEFENDYKQRYTAALNVPPPPKRLHKARKAFNKRKLAVGEKEREKEWAIEVPGLQRDPENDFIEDMMIFSGERLLGYFQPSQDQVLAKITEVTDRIARKHGSPKYCLAAGAYANNILFRKKLEEANHHNMELRTLQNSADSVARGACLTRLHGNFNQFSGGCSKHSIGLLTLIAWDEAVKLNPSAYPRSFKNDETIYAPVLLWAVKKGDPFLLKNLVEEGGDSMRRRTFEAHEDINFTDTLFISDSEIPQNEVYTTLEFDTTDPILWRRNMSNLRTRGITGILYEVTWDMEKVFLTKKDGSEARMQRKDIPIDDLDQRRRGKRRVMFYKYWLHISSADVQVSIETFHTEGNLPHKMILDTKRISMADVGEFESVALPEEYNNLPGSRAISDEPPEESPGSHHTSQGSQVPGQATQRTPSPHVGRIPPHQRNLHTRSLVKSRTSGNLGGNNPLTSSPVVLRPSPSTTRSKRTLQESHLENIQTAATNLQGIASAAQSVLGHDFKRRVLDASDRCLPCPERGGLAAPVAVTLASRANSRYGTRSSTPKPSLARLRSVRNTSRARG